MEWTDLKRLDALIVEAKMLGVDVKSIGTSGEGRPVYGITLGSIQAPYTVVLVAGLHADEVTGSLATVATLRKLIVNPPTNVRFGLVPIADPDFFQENVKQLSTTDSTLRDILNLKYSRDLEGNFTKDTFPECVAIRNWLSQFQKIDAYLSLHTAHSIAPGLFFYVSETSDKTCVKYVAKRTAAALPTYLPLLMQDPTKTAQQTLAPGFFSLSLPASVQSNAPFAHSSLAFVTRQFQPRFVGVSEMPLAICPALDNASLDEIERYNRDFKYSGCVQHSYQEIDLETQINILQTFIESVTYSLLPNYLK